MACQIFGMAKCKCNYALIVGFGDNDHAIRELMRFIEMTSREFIFEDATRNGGAPNYKCRWLQTQRRFKFFYILNKYRKSRTIKGDTMLKLICATKCSNIHIHSQIHSQDSLHFTFTLVVLCGAALPHLKRGTAAVRHFRDLSDRWG